jgi:benzil reductase ((S)-benzoin forming)
MNQHLYILTGASRGMGLAMAEQLLQPHNTLLCISRKTNDALAAQAQKAGAVLEQWPLDLADGAAAGARLEAWLGEQDPSTFASATLINNAGMIPRIAPVSGVPAAELATALRVGLEAPMVLSGVFLRATAAWPAARKLLNISSGLGRRAMDHFTSCVALEEAGKTNGARVCSLAPGVIDTDMQVHLRSADSAAFPDVGNFVGMKEKGQLTSPADAARRVLGYLARPEFGSKPVGDVRD